MREPETQFKISGKGQLAQWPCKREYESLQNETPRTASTILSAGCPDLSRIPGLIASAAASTQLKLNQGCSSRIKVSHFSSSFRKGPDLFAPKDFCCTHALNLYK